jgi:hypothetical protein
MKKCPSCIDGELNGNDLIIKYVFKSAGSVAQTIIDGDPHITGADCDDAVASGTVINTGGRVQNCVRNGDGPVTITTNTGFGPATFFIPPIIKAESVPSKTSQQQSGFPEHLPTVQQVCSTWQGPAPRPMFCYGPRYMPGLNLAPEGYTWCVIDPQFHPNDLHAYCLAREQSGPCHCAIVPPGTVQAPISNRGHVYEGDPRDPPPF